MTDSARKDIAKRIAHVKCELDDMHVQFNRAFAKSELDDEENKVWSAVVKASDALLGAGAFVDRFYYGGGVA